MDVSKSGGGGGLRENEKSLQSVADRDCADEVILKIVFEMKIRRMFAVVDTTPDYVPAFVFRSGAIADTNGGGGESPPREGTSSVSFPACPKRMRSKPLTELCCQGLFGRHCEACPFALFGSQKVLSITRLAVYAFGKGATYQPPFVFWFETSIEPALGSQFSEI